MAFPNSGFIKIWPATVQIISGDWALNSDASPQPSRPVADLQTYYDGRSENVANAPCLRKATEYPAASGVYVPAIGDYELQFSASTLGITFHNSSYPSAPVATLDFINAEFPMGMTINQLKLYWFTQTLFGPNRDREIVQGEFNFFGSNFYNYAPGVGLQTGQVGSPSTGANAIIPSFFTNWSFIQTLKPFGITVPVTSVSSAVAGIPRSTFTNVFLLGVYNTQQFRLNPVGGADGSSNVLPGDLSYLESQQQILENFDPDLFQIYYDDPNSVDPDFPGMTGILIPRRNILTFTASALTFKMPYGLPYGGKRLMLVGTSISSFFVGKFPLQNYNITLVDGSGLYRLTPDKRNDTYYDRSVSPVETIDLKIPDPRAKTGFFNG